MERSLAIAKLADQIARIYLDHPVRVGIDGVDCAGNTMLGDRNDYNRIRRKGNKRRAFFKKGNIQKVF